MSAARGHRPTRWTFAVLVLAIVIALVWVSGGTGPIAPMDPSAGETPGAAAPPAPIRVRIDAVEAESMDNDRLFGEDTQIPDGAVDTAIRQVRDVLATYLNAQFVAPETRFSERPLDGLLSRRASEALSADGRAGLGALGISVWQVDGEPVTADAHVLTRGDEAAIVTVQYDLRAQVRTGDAAPVRMQQRATMVFVPRDGQWRADAVDAVLDLPVPAGRGPR